MLRISRRDFLKGTAAAGATALASCASPFRRVHVVPHKVFGANETIHVGVAGIKGRGSGHIDEFLRIDKVQITHLIDIDTAQFPERVKRVEGAQKTKVTTVQDVRVALEDPELDAISIATPNHWHALMTIWAVQAGKDVYVEKPCSHNVFEGRKAVEAARRHGAIVQHGTQSRSDGRWANLAAVARSGQLGKVLYSHGIASKPRGGIKFAEPTEPPKHIDFNLWLGPAPVQPYHANLVHYNWHWFWDFGNGEIGNQGVHQMDLARWMIPGATLPRSVISLGGRFQWVDQGQTPNTQVTAFDYGESLLVFENCNLTDRDTARVDNDVYFEAGKVIGGGKFIPAGSDQPAPMPKAEFQLGPGRGPFGNFIEAVRSRKHTDLNADILEAHFSSALCHLGNISYRLGREVPFKDNPVPRPFEDDFANEAWEKLQKHLRDHRKINLDEVTYRLGPALTFDPRREKFVDNPEADELLTRHYRPPFVVPEHV